MSTITTEEIKASEDIKTRDVMVSEWKAGASITMSTLTAEAWDHYEQKTIEMQDDKDSGKKPNIKTARVRLIMASAVKPDGGLLFNQSDLPWLMDKSALVINRLYEVAAELNGIREVDIEEMVGNSAGDRSESSPLT